jgi:ATP-grasp domain
LSAAKPIASTAAQWLTAVADCVLRLGALIRGDARITEIEINPLRVYARGALALDVLMQVEQA